MSVEEFNCVVLGDEPAGLWLLTRIAKSFENTPVRLRFGWVRTSNTNAPIAIPKRVAKLFDIPCEDYWHAELITPRRNLLWETESIRELFPELPQHFFSEDITKWYANPLPQHLTSLRKVLRHRPELLAYATGIWKHFGRTQQLQPEVMVWSSLLCRELTWWQAGAGLPSNVEILEINPNTQKVESIEKLKNGGVSLQFKGLPPILSRRWIFNMPRRQLEKLDDKSGLLFPLLGVEEELRAKQALYTFRITTQKENIPAPMQPLSVVFDTEIIPDWDSEIWPMRLRGSEDKKVLELRVSAPRQTSLEAVLQRFRQALGRVHHLLPYLSEAQVHYSVPLSMESCFDESQRFEASRQLEDESIELYDKTSFLTGTRHRDVSAVQPFLNCHLPYPLGALASARLVLLDFMKRKKRDKIPEITANP